MSVDQALQLAFEADLDLVEVAPQGDPPVCKIADYGKLKYMQKKKQQEARKHQVQITIKEIKFRPKTDEHDILVKVKNILKFLEEGDKVDITVVFRGRELAYIDSGHKIIKRVLDLIGEAAIVETNPILEGRALRMRIGPGKKGGK